MLAGTDWRSRTPSTQLVTTTKTCSLGLGSYYFRLDQPLPRTLDANELLITGTRPIDRTNTSDTLVEAEEGARGCCHGLKACAVFIESVVSPVRPFIQSRRSVFFTQMVALLRETAKCLVYLSCINEYHLCACATLDSGSSHSQLKTAMWLPCCC